MFAFVDLKSSSGANIPAHQSRGSTCDVWGTNHQHASQTLERQELIYNRITSPHVKNNLFIMEVSITFGTFWDSFT